MAAGFHPPILFLFLTKREWAVDGPREKIALAQNLHLRAGLLIYERFLNRFRLRQGSLLPARAGLGHSLRSAPARDGRVEISGWLSKGLFF